MFLKVSACQNLRNFWYFVSDLQIFAFAAIFATIQAALIPVLKEQSNSQNQLTANVDEHVDYYVSTFHQVLSLFTKLLNILRRIQNIASIMAWTTKNLVTTRGTTKKGMVKKLQDPTQSWIQMVRFVPCIIQRMRRVSMQKLKKLAKKINYKC